MDSRIVNFNLPRNLTPPRIATGLAMGLLAVEPLQWLIHSWFDDALDSDGVWIFALTAALYFWSAFSPNTAPSKKLPSRAVSILIGTALIRAIGQISAINVIGAITLAGDVYAIGLLTRVNDRKNALSAAWLAALFAFSLPIERILQRLLGFALQSFSADVSCLLLRGFFGSVSCSGVDILLAGHAILVDLPCSGVKSLTLLGILYVALMSLYRPPVRQCFWLGGLALLIALLANTFRIVLLSVFMAFPEMIGNADVTAQPWHDIIGLTCLSLAALPLTLSVRGLASNRMKVIRTAVCLPVDTIKTDTTLPSLAFLIFALAIVNLPRKPLDVSEIDRPADLPTQLNGINGQALPLTHQEQAYFAQYGGRAFKKRYGEHGILLVQTRSPLRHLHAPDECLRGLGFKVAYMGSQNRILPTSVYTAIAPNGQKWRVAVTFYSNRSRVTGNLSEAIWLWLQEPKTTWHAVQRISPLGIPDASVRQFESAVFAALDLHSTTPQENNREKID